MRIAVDFDGTIVENRFPAIGKPKDGSIESLQQLILEGHLLILWTCRHGKDLEEAVSFCKSVGIEFYAVNSNYPEEKFNSSVSRKILADIYIDDSNLFGLPHWHEITSFLMSNPSQTKRKWFNHFFK